MVALALLFAEAWNMNGISSVCHVIKRRMYMATWRMFTAYDWRAANRASRRRHVAERREYDRKRYWLVRMALLHDEALAWERVLEENHCFDTTR